MYVSTYDICIFCIDVELCCPLGMASIPSVVERARVRAGSDRLSMCQLGCLRKGARNALVTSGSISSDKLRMAKFLFVMLCSDCPSPTTFCSSLTLTALSRLQSKAVGTRYTTRIMKITAVSAIIPIKTQAVRTNARDSSTCTPSRVFVGTNSSQPRSGHKGSAMTDDSCCLRSNQQER